LSETRPVAVAYRLGQSREEEAMAIDSSAAGVAVRLRRFADEFVAHWSERTLDAQAVIDHAAQAVPHALAAGLTLVRGHHPPVTLAASDALARQVDAIENETGEGPCIDALEHDDLTHSLDLAAEHRWPKFTERALRETPVRTMFGVRVQLGGADRGALNFYADRPGAFSDLDLGIGAIFSTVTSLVMQYETERDRAANLELALESSRQIGMAMGILMSRRLLTAEQAFDELRRASQLLHRKLRDIAAEVADTGALPDLPG
jgi:hypothetical protein